MSDETPTSVTAADITPRDMPVPTESTLTQGAAAAPESHKLGPAGSTPAPASIPTGTLDDKGHAFDPARHLPRKHPHGGHWLPKGGRKPGSVAQAVSKPADSFIPAKAPPAPTGTGLAERNGQESPENGPALVDHSSDAAEVAVRATQFTAGLVLDAPKECEASPAEHKHMVNATAAYIRSKGWQTAAGVGLLLMFAAWILKVLQQPKPREKVKSWFTPDEPRPVAPADSKPAAAATVIDLPSHVPPLAPRP